MGIRCNNFNLSSLLPGLVKWVQLHPTWWLLCPLSQHAPGYCGEVSPEDRFELSVWAFSHAAENMPEQLTYWAQGWKPESIKSDKQKCYGIGAGSYFLLFWPIVSAVVGEMANFTALIFACNKLSSTPARNFTLGWWVLEFNFQWLRICDPEAHLNSGSTRTFFSSLHHAVRYLAEFHFQVLELEVWRK